MGFLQKLTTFIPSPLNARGLIVDGDGPGGLFTVVKSLDETRFLTSVVSPDNELKMPLQPNERWVGHLSLIYNSLATTDIKTQFSAPVGATGRWSGFGLWITAVTFNGVMVSVSVASFGVLSLIFAGIGPTLNNQVIITFSIKNGPNPGFLQFNWAQSVAGFAFTTVRADSFITASRV